MLIKHTRYKDFYIKRRIDHQTETRMYIGTLQGLRLTAPTLEELKAKIDERSAMLSEIKHMEFKRNGARYTDFSTMYMEPHEVNQLVSHVTTHGVNHYA